ncbi:hypothetical protein [Crocosphaera subtropica]|nr:hypothetical protein [Crocosphaera subtropica]
MDSTISGLYQDTDNNSELRLDVDGYYPLMVASGKFNVNMATSIHWIADLTKTGSLSWEGGINYQNPVTVNFPFTRVNITVDSCKSISNPRVVVVFSGLEQSDITHVYHFTSPHFHTVEFEYDIAEGTEAVTSIETHAHPDRPATLANETLTIEKVYERAGFEVKVSPGTGSVISITGAASPGERFRDRSLWDDAEMHDAMQTFWSRFENQAQWSMWVFFAKLHEEGESLGGIMFDDIGPNHRQGTAMFNDSFIAQAPIGDGNAEAWVRRMRFWTAVHEMGHAFNLAHAWQKNIPNFGSSWVPLENSYDYLSFMNYPFLYETGNFSDGNTVNFFRRFEYRFSDDELRFMRHAPESFVQMGNANWFDNHGFENANVSPIPSLQLEIRVNRPQAIFEFLEPVSLELKLKNVSSQPQIVDSHILDDLDEMIIIIKKDKQSARQFIPYARHCWRSHNQVLRPGESIYKSLFISAGNNGWDLAEPGYYTLQMALEKGEEYILSNALRIRITPPKNYDEEFLAQDYFCEDVARILNFKGSLFLSKGNDILREISAQLSDRRVAIHAEVALETPMMRHFKQLVVPEGASNLQQAKISTHDPDVKQVKEKLSKALLDNKTTAAETLGNINFKASLDRLSDFLADMGEKHEAVKVQEDLLKTLSERGVKKRVLEACQAKKEKYQQ